MKIFFTNTPEVESFIKQIEDSLFQKDDRIKMVNATILRVSFDQPEGRRFLDDSSTKVPVAIFIEGHSQFNVNGKNIKFYGYPKEQQLDGLWSMKDLTTAIYNILDEKKGK